MLANPLHTNFGTGLQVVRSPPPSGLDPQLRARKRAKAQDF